MNARYNISLLLILFLVTIFVRLFVFEEKSIRLQNEHFRATDQTLEDRGFLVLTKSHHNHTLYTVVLSPRRGFVVGIGTTAMIPCPVPTYGHESFEMRIGNDSYVSSKVQQEELQGGPLIVSHFRIDNSRWDELMLRSTEVVAVLDHVLNTTHSLPVLVDPILKKGGGQHTFSATTTVRKQYKYYQGMSKYQNGTNLGDSWSDEETVNRLNHWINFHRVAGVKHFYIVDNEIDQSKPTLQINGTDITYIRANHIFYDIFRCYSDEHTQPKNWLSVVGQLVLENSIIQFAHTNWLLIGDIDEFFIAGDEFDHDLNKVVENFQNIHCRGEKPVECKALNQTDYQQVFALNFMPQTMTPSNERLFEVTFRFKPILRPNLTSSLSVHYSLPNDVKQSTSTTIPPRHGWLAHYSKRGEKNHTGNSQNWTTLLSTVYNHSKFLRDK